MRHVVGFLSGLLLGPLLVLIVGWAFSHLRNLHAGDVSALAGSGPLALCGLAAAGLILAMVAVPPRLTPMPAFGAALTIGALSAAAMVRMHLLERLPMVPGAEGALVLLPLGVFVPVVVLLLAPLFNTQRWVRGADGEVSEEEYFEGLYEEEGPSPARPKHRL